MRPHIDKYIIGIMHFWIISALVIFTLSVRLFLFDALPGEWFGDISNVHEYMTQIIRGDWPFYFFQSPGPLYHYLIAPIVFFLQGLGYETYKIASILVSLIGLIGTYLLAKELAGVRIALITVMTMSFSFWYLVWSRLGNSQIVIPALSSLMGYFLIRYIKNTRLKDLFQGAVIASLGWYTYPQTFIFPPLFLIAIIFHHLLKKTWKKSVKELIFTILFMIILAIPFINLVRTQKDNFGTGYIGQKVIPAFMQSPATFIQKFSDNYVRTLLMFHHRGDNTFRVNVPGMPELDRVSGIILFLGIWYFGDKRRRIWLFLILFTTGVLILPSISPAIESVEIPNSSRTIAVIPFICLLVSAGLFQLYIILHKTFGKSGISKALISIIIMLMVFLNLKTYFRDYPDNLPDRNQAWGKEIAQYIDTLPSEINIYFGSCCWGQWGHPEPKAVAYTIRRPGRFIKYDYYLSDCRQVVRFPAMVIVGPNDDKIAQIYKSCFPQSSISDIYGKNQNILMKTIEIPHAAGY